MGTHFRYFYPDMTGDYGVRGHGSAGILGLERSVMESGGEIMGLHGVIEAI